MGKCKYTIVCRGRDVQTCEEGEHNDGALDVTVNEKGGAIGEAEWRTSVLSCSVSSRASNQSARLGLAFMDGVLVCAFREI